MSQLPQKPQSGTRLSNVSITSDRGAKIAPQTLAEVVKFADVMCTADLALPKHLRGNAGACMAIAMQALEWEMSPFAVASKSYAVNGQIAYEAQLIMAVVNTRSGIEGRLKFAFEGTGLDRVCIAYGKLDGEVYEVRSPRFGDITPKNSPLWKSDPDQQHCYYTARAWGRRYTPEVLLGVYDREEIQQAHGPNQVKDGTPSLQERLSSRKHIDPVDEGFDADNIQNQLTQARTADPEEIAPEGEQPQQEERQTSPEVLGASGKQESTPANLTEGQLELLTTIEEALSGCRTAKDIDAVLSEFGQDVLDAGEVFQTLANKAVHQRRADLDREQQQ